MTVNPSRAADHVFGNIKSDGPLGIDQYLGEWANTNPATTRVRRLRIDGRNSEYTIRVWGVASDAEVDWGTQPAQAFECTEENGVQSAALVAVFDLGFMQTSLQLRLNKGILPMMSFTTFTDDSGRSNYYTREFFHRISHVQATS